MIDFEKRLSDILKELQLKSFHAGKLGSDYKYAKNREEATQAIINLFEELVKSVPSFETNANRLFVDYEELINKLRGK